MAPAPAWTNQQLDLIVKEQNIFHVMIQSYHIQSSCQHFFCKCPVHACLRHLAFLYQTQWGKLAIDPRPLVPPHFGQVIINVQLGTFYHP